ncbi:monovalent cation/H+ antiporter subunit D [Usitatibacter palustris]|uniref:Na(+)/H(+) antiporter subunit D n=1 Tax=Usitatibacter palustris TaxID=2732487 RepID=A0A6M4H660_9PROT|nr:monovalent cation/H+ antiporter subunit D [Usitatibacter palustris]QJR14812.1 Na(+)/H(+) antiporter subunit D [Usitatibacter palustris]
MNWAAHLPILPVLLPLATGAALLLLDARTSRMKAGVGLASVFVQLIAAVALLRLADAPAPTVYALGNWPAPFGIVLVADRLAAVMVLLTTLLGAAALVFSLARWHGTGRFPALLQFLLMGLNGAFLTGDLFNLFVFFELLLVASYGLALHGSGVARVRASLHYIVVNLAASLLFLVGVSLIYGVTGTLNMAQLVERIPEVAVADRAILESGAAILAIAFLVKAAVWPLGFWLPATYAAASAPAAALFAILSKVGVYAVLRLYLLFFGGQAGSELLFYGGIATGVFGAAGMLAAQGLGGVAASSLVVSSGTLLAAISRSDAGVTSGALFYLVGSTLGLAALFMLVELVQRARAPGADVLAVTGEAFGIDNDEEPGEGSGPAIPATMALLGVAFLGCTLQLAGMPPLPAFLAKVSMLSAVLAPTPVEGPAWVLLALLLVTGLAALVALARAGVAIFWAEASAVPRVLLIELAPIAALLALCLALTIAAGPAMRYFQDAADALHSPKAYVDAVLPRR